jgi:SAM-dependent methyltransferase
MMEITKSIFDALLERVTDASKNENYEFEFILSATTLRVDGFNRIMTQLYRSKDFTLVETTSREQLDVRTATGEHTNIRMSLNDKGSILGYCKTGDVNMKHTTFTKKTTIPERRPIMLDDYHVRANLKREETLMDTDGTFDRVKYLRHMRSIDKHYRYKKRYSFLHKNKNHRVDLTVVRSSKKDAPTMIKSGVLNEKEHYEVEVEYLPLKTNSRGNARVDSELREMLQTVQLLCKVNAGVDYLLPRSKKHTIVKEYATLIDPILKDKEPKYIIENPSEYYLKYQPVTLMKRNLLPPDVDVVSIRDNYCVTDKADGERYILYISGDGKMYLINNLLDVIYTGMTHSKYKKTIIDGELINKGRLGVELNLFAAFDVYFVDGKDVRSMEFIKQRGESDNKDKQGVTHSMSSRLGQLQAILASDKDKDNMVLEKTKSRNQGKGRFRAVVKTFEYGTDIFASSKRVLDRLPALSYNTDGLIYTPNDLSPGALYKDDKTMKPFGGSWSKVFKWKPPEDNSIDVFVKLGKVIMLEVEPGVTQRCVYVKLYVAFKGTLDEIVDVGQVYNQMVVDMATKKKQGKLATTTKGSYSKGIGIGIDGGEYVHRFYDGTYLPLGSDEQFPRINGTNEEFHSNEIIEFTYNSKSSNDYRKWIPIRSRRDKTDLYIRNDRRIENTANNYFTVVNVWRSIVDPVEKDLLMGTIPFDEPLVKRDDDDVYYARSTPRARSLSVPMLDFHNYWVKNKSLLNLFKGKNMRLLDIGCGQGGDLPKWAEAGFKVVVGIDNNEDNLLNTDHGIYKRYYNNVEMHHQAQSRGNRRGIDPEKQRMIFLLMDGGKEWTSEYIDNIASPQFKKLTKLAFGMGYDDKHKEPNMLLRSFHDIMHEGFDVVSCQFAIHYFFESSETLDAFCSNVNNMLSPNGYFIGTALDGHAVNDHFVGNNTNVLRGEMNGKVIWQMEKKYTHYATDTDDDSNLGKQIDVYVETINKRIPEYLVDFDLLKRKLEVHGIRLVDFKTEDTIFSDYERPTSSFEYLFDRMKANYEKGRFVHHATKNAIDNMNDTMKEYSFLNRWFIFKKYI